MNPISSMHLGSDKPYCMTYSRNSLVLLAYFFTRSHSRALYHMQLPVALAVLLPGNPVFPLE